MSWGQDMVSKSPDAPVSKCGQAVNFHISALLENKGTAAARGSKGFTRGEHYLAIWPPYGASVMVGVGIQNAPLHAHHQFINLIGMDAEGWGLSYKGTMGRVSGALFPMVSFTAPETELQLGVRSSRLSSLQELCIHTITHCLSPGYTHALPLPTALCCQICNYKTDIYHHTPCMQCHTHAVLLLPSAV